MEEASEVTPIDRNIAFKSAKCYLELMERAKVEGLGAPSLFDAIVLAKARTLGAKLLTGDRHPKEFTETLWIGKLNQS